MKKIVTTILVFLYLAITSGATVHLHYCMGELVEQSLSYSEEQKCGKCGMDNDFQDNECCKDEHKQINFENDHYKSSVAFQAMQLTAIALPVYFNQIPPVVFSSVTEENPMSHAPPRSCGLAIYKRNGVFRI